MKIKCKHCHYEWTTKSKLQFVSCPSCLSKNENNTEEKQK